jgi:SAM-dependent methyltransferase
MSGSYEKYYREAYEAEGGFGYDLGADPDTDVERYAVLRSETRAWLDRTGVSSRRSAHVLELGCGLGQLRDVHEGWVGLEFSETAVARVRELHPDVRVLHGDMQSIPVEDASMDAVYSWAAIEHVPQPERVMAEVERVLVPGGVAILAPAWNCRAWTVKRLQVRPYRDLSLRDAVGKATIPIRNLVAWRAAAAMPRRLAREIALSLFKRPLRFDYKRLHPDFSLDVPHITDDDAQASMDPHAAITYFASRGWTVISHPTFVARMASRGEPVVVRKPP